MVMMNETSTEGAAMFSGKTSKPGNSNLSLRGKEEHWCSHCKKFGHTKDTCFKLHGKEKALNRLAELKGQPSRKAYQASLDSENLDKTPSSSSTKEGMPTLHAEIERLKTLESISKPPSGTCSLTMTGKNSNSSFNVSRTLCMDSWVLDSGATNHMTPHSSLLTSFVTLSNNHITIANGTHIPIHGRGNVSLLPSLSLKDVLYVPKLSNNLISIRKLTHDLNCSITFFPTHCTFQDLATGKLIGVVKE